MLRGMRESVLQLEPFRHRPSVACLQDLACPMPERCRTPVSILGANRAGRLCPEDKAQAAAQQSSPVVEAVGEGIYGIDLDGEATIVNHAAAKMLGYRPEEILGRNMHRLMHHTKMDGSPYLEKDSPIRNSAHNLTSIRVDHEVFWRKDGASFPVEYVALPQIEYPQPACDTAVPISGRAVGVVVAFSDKNRHSTLDRMKDEFISTVSHELRTPLTSLRAALGLLAGGTLEQRPEKSQQMMEIAIQNADRLADLVTDIMDWQRISSGQAEFHPAFCSMTELIEKVTSSLKSSNTKAHPKFAIEDEGVVVWADPQLLFRALSQLISNAIQSADSAALPATVRIKAKYLGADEAMIEIHDQGPGIPNDKLESIFDRFSQVDSSDSRSLGGTGLGLAMCRGILALHGGRIWATSTLGQGTTMHLSLPTNPRVRR